MRKITYDGLMIDTTGRLGGQISACAAEDWMDKARANMVEGLEYGEITLDDLDEFAKKYDAHMLNKRREIAKALREGCGIK